MHLAATEKKVLKDAKSKKAQVPTLRFHDGSDPAHPYEILVYATSLSDAVTYQEKSRLTCTDNALNYLRHREKNKEDVDIFDRNVQPISRLEAENKVYQIKIDELKAKEKKANVLTSERVKEKKEIKKVEESRKIMYERDFEFDRMCSVIKMRVDFDREQTVSHFSALINENREKVLAIYKKTLSQLGFSCEALCERFFSEKKIDYLSVKFVNIFTQCALFQEIYVMQQAKYYDIKFSKWQPRHGFRALLENIRKYGPHYMHVKDISFPFVYIGKRSPLKNNQELCKVSKIETSVSGHAVVVVGGKFIGTEQASIYLIDPNSRCSFVQSAPVFEMDYKIFRKYIYPIDSLELFELGKKKNLGSQYCLHSDNKILQKKREYYLSVQQDQKKYDYLLVGIGGLVKEIESDVFKLVGLCSKQASIVRFGDQIYLKLDKKLGFTVCHSLQVSPVSGGLYDLCKYYELSFKKSYLGGVTFFKNQYKVSGFFSSLMELCFEDIKKSLLGDALTDENMLVDPACGLPQPKVIGKQSVKLVGFFAGRTFRSSLFPAASKGEVSEIPFERASTKNAGS